MTSSPVIANKRVPANPLSSKPEFRRQDEALRVSHVPAETKENYIELHMDNASEDSKDGEKKEAKAKASEMKYFSQLKSHRQEIRRSFSPPFAGKENSDENESSFQKKLDFLQVQRANIFHDSLEEIPRSYVALLGQTERKDEQAEPMTKVVNEEG
jgi:hypothetical protein